jgi:hypothetical protein
VHFAESFVEEDAHYLGRFERIQNTSLPQRMRYPAETVSARL